MPVFEHQCNSCGRVAEHYYGHPPEVNPPCEICGEPTERLLSAFNSPFTGIISSRYIDRSIKGSESASDGHWAWERNTPDKKPRARFISSWQEQRDFCKSEGLINPRECGNNIQPRDDGKGLQNSVGMPGCEV